MNETVQTTRLPASAYHVFALYALSCCFTASTDGVSGRTEQDVLDLQALVKKNRPEDSINVWSLLCRMFPKPVREALHLKPDSRVNPAELVLSLPDVQKFWRYTHVGSGSDSVKAKPDHGCRTIRAKVIKTSPVPKVFIVEFDGRQFPAVDFFDLNPEVDRFVYIHLYMICEVEEPYDYYRSIGFDGGENQFGPAEPPDSEEIRPAYETSSVGLGGRYELVTDIHADGDSVEVYHNPTTALSPTTAEHCECGHECKSGHCCPCAPHHVQFRDTSDEVVSPGRIVGGVSVVGNVVCTASPVEDAGQLRLLVEEDYHSSPSPADTGDKSKPGNDRPNLSVRPAEKIVMGDDHLNPYRV